jgi:transcriptional regulator with XRE-family HTH domain
MATKDEGLKRAIEAAGGSAEKLAAKLGITPQALSQWEKIPLKRVFQVESETGVPPHIQRPDFFPAPANAEASS